MERGAGLNALVDDVNDVTRAGKAVDTLTAPSAEPGTEGLVSPVVRAFRLLRYVVDGGSTANLSEVGRQIAVNRVTVMRLLATLEHEGILTPLPQGGHRVGLPFLKLAAGVLASDDLLGHARGILAHTRRSLQLSAYLAVLEGGDVVFLLRDMPEAGLVSAIKVGSRLPAMQATPGRILMAQFEEQDLDEETSPLAHALAHADTASHMRDTLAQDRARGCAWSYSGLEAGIDSCAAPVFDASGAAVAAISVAGPDRRFAADPALHERVELTVKRAAADLSRLLGHRVD